MLRAERAQGRIPAGAPRILAAWIGYLRGAGVPVTGPRADELVGLPRGPQPDAVRRVIGILDLALGEDSDVVATILSMADELLAWSQGYHGLHAKTGEDIRR